MTKRYPALFIMILLLAGTATLQGMGELDVYATGSGLTGQVVDVSGRGISGVGIWIIGGEGQATNTTTNATGYYGMSLPPGKYSITAELSGYSFTSSAMQVQTGTLAIAPRITGYATGTASTAPIAPAATAGFDRYGQPLAAAGVGWVQGRVVDQNGAGIPSASITVDGFGTSGATDEQGNYRLALSPGLHTIDPVSSGYGIPPRAVLITSGETNNLDITAKRTVALGGGRLR
ncbi:MAG TPA: carboxypeptidase-like regulatory domain-containing protein [Methanothrix sp.]